MIMIAKVIFMILTFILFINIIITNGQIQPTLELKEYYETPQDENHIFRSIAVSKSGQHIYITDSYTDVVYIYRNDGSNEPIASFGDDSWKTDWVGPYGIDVAEDEQVYIAIFNTTDNNGDGVADNSLWRSTPNGKHLELLCYLPDFPRGLKVIGGGANTAVYIAGTIGGSVIKCTRTNSYNFKAEILFNAGISVNQQCVLAEKEQANLFISSYGTYTPYSCLITKWNVDGIRDENFSPIYLPSGNVPGLCFGIGDNALYALDVAVFETGKPVYIYKLDPSTGEEIGFINIGSFGPGGGNSTGAGDININKKGEIFFSYYHGYRNSFAFSSWGKVIDKALLKRNLLSSGNGEFKAQSLLENYPNPFNPTTTIGYVLQEKSSAKLTVLNALGEEVAVLVNEEQDKGYHKVEFDGSKLSSGVYFYKLVAKDFVSTKKMMLVR